MTVFPQLRTWNRDGLLEVGFTGFVPLIGLDVATLPARRGIYVILRETDAAPVFVAENPITRRTPYSVEQLRLKWVPDQSIVYVGKADPSDGIRGRLGAFSRKSSGHSGGRALWQLADASSLLAAWMETPGFLSAHLETEWLKAFRRQHGTYPFANWRG